MTVKRVNVTETDPISMRRAIGRLNANDEELQSRILVGTGDPSAVLGTAAEIGTLFLRTDGTESSTMAYLKYGAADTNWKKL